MISILDLLDARMEQLFQLIDSAPAGEEFTWYVPLLARQLFRGFEEHPGKTRPADGGKTE